MFVKLLTLLVLFAIVFQSEARYGCQNPNVARTRSLYNSASCNSMCRCTYSWSNADYTYKTVYKCDGFNRRIGEFEKYIKDCLKNTDFDDLIINNYKLDRLPDSVFDGNMRTMIKRIIISNSPSLKNFGYRGSTKTFFDGLGQSLETIVITNSPNILVEEWTNLVNSLAAGSDPPVLKNLIVYNQKEAIINEFATFNELINLEKIIFRAINLKALIDSPIDLTPFTKLRLLDLSENRLEGLFDAKLPDSLTTIYLNGNRELKGFSPQFFEEITKVSSNVDYINVQDPNKLDCTCANINDYVSIRLSNIFDGKCATPSQVRGKPYLSTCYGNRKIKKYQNWSKPQKSEINKIIKVIESK